ncbi:hypothetical protein U9M48_023429 [Paspalum notatum var. saurae]|uniref:RING-type E3 ubiquitin transferase n=1 Tax=Paspalum notatum var. saurae TaxID=547442 RepID=A0AAQ3WUQ1_PASNO
MSQRRSSHSSSGDEDLEDKLLRQVEREIQEKARAVAAAERRRQRQPTRCFPSPTSWVARRVLGVARRNPADRTSPTRTSPPRSPRRGQASSAPCVPAPARTGSEEETRSEQDQAPPTRSDYVEMMRCSLANIKEGADGQEKALFAKMEEAITGLLELAHGTAKLPNPPKLPREFATRWPGDDDADLLQVMDDPVILASGHSVDRLYNQFVCPQQNCCPVTQKSMAHSSTAPNHLLRDMISAWRFDHMAHSSTSTADTLSVPVVPSEEQVQDILPNLSGDDILQKLSGDSVMQKQALHDIELLSKITKGEQPCLHKCPHLLPELINLKKNWKSTWTHKQEEQRLGVILNLSVDRTNREILSGENLLPVTLKNIINSKQHRYGSPASAFAKVCSIIAILSEFGVFRKGIFDIGGMEMLRDLLKIEHAVVRKEAVSAIRGLCADEEGKTNAQSYNVPDALLECLMVSEDVLILLDCLPKDLCVVDKMCDKVVELVNIIMTGQGNEPVTPQGTNSAISLVHTIVQRDAHTMAQVKNLKDFKERLKELSSGKLPMQTMLQPHE